jgi:prepilin-type N-terminal cleavage/methylation domain-containing protein
MFTKFNRNKRGFSLIELLVVISIIGLLSSVVLASLQTARQKAQGARIVQGMNQIKNAFELYRADTGKYPNEGVASCKDSLGWCGEGYPISYLSNVLSPKYISLITDYASLDPYFSSGTNLSIYMTGPGYLYYEDPNNPSWEFSYTCNKIKLKGYFFEFYSTHKLNYPHPGYQDGFGDYYDFEPIFTWDDNSNWYCIGE